MKKTLIVLFLGSILCFFEGCALMKPPPPLAAKQTFSFDYKLPSTEKLGSAGTVLALIKPNYGNNFAYGDNDLFRRLRLSMADDVEELIIDKGFTIKSDEPFETLDEMIFDDKKNTDMAIKIELNPEFASANGTWKTNISLLRTVPSYSYSGTVSLIGKITLTGIEPLSGQKIWTKSVTIPEIQNIPIRTEFVYDSTSAGEQLLYNDPGIYNAIGAAFSKQYQSVMGRIAAHFSPEEFKSLKPQIKELKSRKGY